MGLSPLYSMGRALLRSDVTRSSPMMLIKRSSKRPGEFSILMLAIQSVIRYGTISHGEHRFS